MYLIVLSLYCKLLNGAVTILIRKEIIKWVRVQPYWIQVLSDNILKGGVIDDLILDEVYKIFKLENGLEKGVLHKKQLEFIDVTDSTDIIDMKWESISNIKGVNALKEDESLKIGKQISLIYGENGSGKSGYTRMLNNAFISRGDTSILGNVFKNIEVEANAVFSFKDDNNQIKKLLFPKDKNNQLFEQVSIFDTSSAVHDLTKESEMEFVPTEFKFFDDLTQAFLEIKSKFQNEIKDKETDNDFSDYFDKDTKIKEFVKSINGQTNFEEVILQADTSRLEDIYKNSIKRKKSLQALNIEKIHEDYYSFIKKLTEIKQKIVLFNSDFTNEKFSLVKELLAERTKLKELSFYEGLDQLKGENLYRLGSPEWKKFILAARRYYESIDEDIENCIFCGQNIDDVRIINKYWKYLKSTAEKNLAITDKHISQMQTDFASRNFSLIIKGSKLEEWLRENRLKLFDKLIAAENELKSTNAKVIESLFMLEWDDSIEPYYFEEYYINDALEVLSKSIEDLNAEEISKELKSIECFLNEYDDRLRLKNILPKIEIFIKNKKWVDTAKEIILTTGQITVFQKKIFSDYVSDKYIEKFNMECRNLKADFSAEIQQRGRRGNTLSKLTIKGKSPVEVLSEGEQRSVALANFFAETGLNTNNTCVVFDDPVSSLDYKRREIIANRLVAEANKKQVVILTHDITFLLSIQNICKSLNIDCRTTTIRKIDGESGVVQEEPVPWIGMTVSKRLKFLRHELQGLYKIYGKSYESYNKEAKTWCQLLRETWERTIEEILFNDSIQRFNPAIQTQRLKKAPFSQELYSEIENGMANCSKWVHDRASSLGEDAPDPIELKSYLDSCKKFVESNSPN